MRIAIPINNNRISPRFIYTDKFLIIDAENGEITRKEVVFAGETHLLKRVKFIIDLKVDVLICGGIDRFAAMQIRYHGIDIFNRVNEEIDEVIQRFMNNELELFNMDFNECRRGSRFGSRKKSMNQYNQMFLRKEAHTMPAGDGTGPTGKGPGTGRGQGPCRGGTKRGGGKGRGQGQGMGGGRGQGGQGSNQRSVRQTDN